MRRLENKVARLRSELESAPRLHTSDALAADPVLFAEQALCLELDPWQADVIGGDAKRDILNCSRQAGKSTTAAVLALHEALYHPSSVSILISPSQRQSSELFRKVIDLRETLPWPVDLTEDNRLSMTVRGGGRVVSLPGSEATVRGYTATLLIEDEAAKVDDLLFQTTRPMLSTTNGRHVLMSTPWGKRGHFHEVWSEYPEWARTKVTVHDVPRISPEWIAEEKKTTPPHIWASEYECEFVDTTDQVFATDDIWGAVSDEIEPLFPEGP